MKKGKRNYSTPSTYSTSGALIKDPETIELPDGKKLLKFTLVDGTKSERHTDFFPEITVGGERIAYLSRLRKGDFVRVEGKPELRVWVGKTGNYGISFEIRFPRVFESLTYLGDREGTETQPSGPETDLPPIYEIPF